MKEKQLELFDNLGFPILHSIDELFPDYEYSELEYKSAAEGFPNDFWKTYSAFANTNGGIIILGVREKKGYFIKEGLTQEQINKYKKYFWDNINNPSTVCKNILQEDDVKDFTTGGKHFIAFKIPIAHRTEKPLHLTRNPFDNTYKRNYEGDYRCSKDEVRRMIADADITISADSRILNGFDFQDFDNNSINQFRQLMSISKPDHPWLSLSIEEFLLKIGAIRKDRNTKLEGPTVAGILMFGKTESITDPECVQNFFPDYREILSSDSNIRWTDRIYPDGTWESNLFQFYRKVLPKLYSSLPKPFHMESGIRKDESPAHIALREAFINTLVHTDYTATGNIVIEHQIESYVFSNPGTLLVSLYQYYNGGISECRNITIQKMFTFIGSAEKAGSGVDKIMKGWDYAHWRRPFLNLQTEPDRVILKLPMFSVLPEQTLNELHNIFGENIDILGKEEVTILATCHIEEEISNNRLQYMLDLHRTDITRTLQDLCKKNYLISDGKGRGTTYKLNYAFLESLQDTASNDATSNNDATFDDATSNNDATSDDATSNDFSTKRKRNISRERIENEILEFCNDNYKTKDEIAAKVNKSVSYIRNNFINELLQKELLIRKFDQINHPEQAYKSKKRFF